MDVELLFSAQPFGQNLAGGGGGAARRFALVRPRATTQVALRSGAEETVVSLAAALPQLRCARRRLREAAPSLLGKR